MPGSKKPKTSSSVPITERVNREQYEQWLKNPRGELVVIKREPPNQSKRS
jgi:hypothetical protein